MKEPRGSDRLGGGLDHNPKEGDMRLGVAAALVDRTIVPGDVIVENGAIARLGSSPAADSGLAVPGYVDLQVNGFAGVDFLSADAAGYRDAGLALAATGVTAWQPTFITSPLEAYWPALETVAGLDPDGGPRVLGVHLEGPFISPSWPGAHRAAHILRARPRARGSIVLRGTGHLHDRRPRTTRGHRARHTSRKEGIGRRLWAH